MAEQLQAAWRASPRGTSLALGRIFGNEQLQAANVLYREGGSAVEDWTRNVNDAGFAAETARIKTDNLRGDIERLGGAIDTALISGGRAARPAAVVDAVPYRCRGHFQPASRVCTERCYGVAHRWRYRGRHDLGWHKTDPHGRRHARGAGEHRSRWGEGQDRSGLATKGIAALTIGFIAYQEASRALGIGIKDDDIRRMTEMIAARTGPDVEAQIRATTAAIEEQQKISDEGFGINLGVTKVFPFSQAAADAQDKVDGLQKSLAELQHQQDLTGFSAATMNQAVGDVPLVGGVLGELAADAGEVAESHKNMGVTVVQAGKAVRFTAEEIKAAKDEYADQVDAARDVGDEFFGLGQKVDKAKVSLGEWLRDLEKQAKALEDFTANAKSAGDKGLAQGLIRELEKAGPAGALRMQQLANASETEIGRANRAWKRGQNAIKDYIKETTKVPSPLRIDVNTQQAHTAIESLQRALRQLRSVQMEVRLGATNYATGGHVRGPGTGTSDSIPAYLSNGEYVVRAAAVQKYGTHMFDRLNAMHFAQGGSVGRSGGGGVSIDYGQLASALAQMRPIYGDVHYQGSFDDFKRMADQDRVAAAGDGWRR